MERGIISENERKNHDKMSPKIQELLILGKHSSNASNIRLTSLSFCLQ